MSTEKRNGVRVVRVDGALLPSLRLQTLRVLEFEHFWFESIADRTASEQDAAARTFRGAFAVLDAIGWRGPAAEGTLLVPLTPTHLVHLRRLGRDLEQAMADRVRFASSDARADPEVRAACRRDAASLRDLRAINALVRRSR